VTVLSYILPPSLPPSLPPAALPSLSASYGRRGAPSDPLMQPYDPARTTWKFKIIADLDQQSK
jgi:hypothetical protein